MGAPALAKCCRTIPRGLAMPFRWLFDRVPGSNFTTSLTAWSRAAFLCVALVGIAAGRSGAGPLFTTPAFETGLGPISVAIGDVSVDGKPDLVVANDDASTVSVLLGNLDGTFQVKVDYATGLNPQCVAIGDVNGDGKPDVVTA